MRPEYSQVTGHGGVRLTVREAGPPDAPPLILLHGWAQSSQAWEPQFAPQRLAGQFRVIAADLRGHGSSHIPEPWDGDSAAWAGDVAALLAHAGAPAVLVGWSYGGLVITDYLRHHGTAGLAGIALVGAITEIGRNQPPGGRLGPVMAAALPDVLSDDPELAVPALSRFIADLSAAGLPGEAAQRLLGTALQIPPRVRKALFRREVSSQDVLAAVDVPALVLHGEADPVVDIAAGRYAAQTIPGATACWYAGCGHLPFVERADQFAGDLGDFARRCHGGTGKMES